MVNINSKAVITKTQVPSARVLMARQDFRALPAELFCVLGGVPHVLASVGGRQVFTPVQILNQ